MALPGCRASALPRKPVRRPDQPVQDARLGKCVAGALDQVELGLRPGLVQRPGEARRARHVVAAVHDDAGNALQPSRVADQLPLLQPAGMDEEVVLDAGEGDGIVVLAERRAGLGLGQQA